MTSLSSTGRVDRMQLLLAILCLTSMAIGVEAQTSSSPQGSARKIVSEDFTRNRQDAPKDSASTGPKAQTSGNTSPKPKTRRTYRLASQQKKARPNAVEAFVAQLGITIWRLRPLGPNETGARMLVREKGRRSERVPERVEADTIFREGDQLRLSIESPRVGYLYVVDRELLEDGSTGPAMLIYPWANMVGPDNKMRPGKLVDIPAQEDEPSYFTARRSTPNQVGEILTIIITTSPLDLPISDQPLRISAADLSKWVKLWEGESERFEMEGGAGEAWTLQEQLASAGRGTRQLTREDPSPQTIYRVSSSDNKALLVNVQLRYAH